MNILMKLTAVATAIVAGCQTTPSVQSPAVLSSASPDNMAKLKDGLAKAMNKNSITLGANDPTVTATVAVLPPRTGDLGHSTVLPTLFDLVTDGQDCYAKKRGNEDLVLLPGVDCEALQ